MPNAEMFNEREILDHLSHPLQSEIAMLKCRDVLQALRVLDNDNLARKIALSLKRVVFVSGDCVLHEGDYGRGMYFITSGAVHIIVRGSSQPMAQLGKHSFFGEMSLLEPGGKVTASTIVSGYMEGWQLTRESFYELLGQFPFFREYIVNVARKRRGQAAQSPDGCNKGGSTAKSGEGVDAETSAASERLSMGDEAALVEMPLAKRKLLRNARRESRCAIVPKASLREATARLKQAQLFVREEQEAKANHSPASTDLGAKRWLRAAARASVKSSYDRDDGNCGAGSPSASEGQMASDGTPGGTRRASRASVGSKYDLDADDASNTTPNGKKTVRMTDDFAA